MHTELTEQEEQWVDRWMALVNKMPEPLLMMTDADSSDGAVVVILADHEPEKPSHTRWIVRMNNHLEAFPEGDAWLLANADGWMVGKGNPTVTSSPSYTAHGASSFQSDNYADHYVKSVMMPHGSVPEGFEIIAHLKSDQGNRNPQLRTMR